LDGRITLSKKTAYDIINKLRDHVNDGGMFTIPLGSNNRGGTILAHIYRMKDNEMIMNTEVVVHTIQLKGLSIDEITFWSKTGK